MLLYVLGVILLIVCIKITIKSYFVEKHGPPGPKGYPFLA